MLSKQKQFSKKFLLKSALILTMLLALNGCSFLKKNEKIVIVDKSCAKHFDFPNDPEAEQALLNTHVKIYEYVKVTETTDVCDCKPTEEIRQTCYKKFSDLDNAKK